LPIRVRFLNKFVFFFEWYRAKLYNFVYHNYAS
jgi:hypothetical protein